MNDQNAEKNNTAEQEHSEKRGLIIPLVLSVLVAVIAVQAWYLLDMKHQIEGLRASDESSPVNPPENPSDSSIATTAGGSSLTPVDSDLVTAGQESGTQHQTAADESAMDQPGLAQSTQETPDQAPASRPALQNSDSAAGLADNTAGNTSIDPAPRHPSRSPFDDPFFRPGFPHGLDKDPYDWDPYREIERMQREMDAIMRDAFNRHGLRYHPRGYPHFEPDDSRNRGPESRAYGTIGSGNFQIEDKGDRYLVRLSIPGADKKYIKVDIDELSLTVSGEQHQSRDRTDQFGNTTFKQRMSSSFKHRVSLPGPVKPESMRTRFNGDVLEMMVSKAG